MSHNEVPFFSLEVCSSENIQKGTPPGGGDRGGSFLLFFPGSANLFSQKRAPHFDTCPYLELASLSQVGKPHASHHNLR